MGGKDPLLGTQRMYLPLWVARISSWDPTYVISSMGEKDPILGTQRIYLPPWAAGTPSWGSIICNFLYGRKISHLRDLAHVFATMGGKDPILGNQHI